MAAIISNCTRVSVVGTNSGGRPWAIVQHWVGAGGTPPAPLAGSNGWVAAFIANVLPVLSAGISVTGGFYTDLRTSSGASGPTAAIGPPVQGGGSGTMCPPNTAGLVKLATSGSRSQRSGRMFLPGIDEDQVDAAGNMTSGLVGDLQTAMDAFWDELTGINIIPVVNSKTSETTYAPATVTGMIVQEKVATQRRRLRR